MAPTPTGTAFCMARPRVRNSRAVSEMLRLPAAASAEYSPSECPATKAASRPTEKPASVSSTRKVAKRDRHQRRLGVFGELQGLGRAVPDDGGQLFPERRIDLVEHRARGRKSLRQGLAHADRLGALPRKGECCRHRPNTLNAAGNRLKSGRKTPREPLDVKPPPVPGPPEPASNRRRFPLPSRSKSL